MNRIHFIISGMTRGGAERVVANLANRFSDQTEVSIVIIAENKIMYELDSRIKVVDLTENETLSHLSVSWKLRSYISGLRSDEDTVIAFLAKTNIFYILSTLGIRIPLIISERNDPYNDGRGTVLKLLTRILYPLADLIVFQTNYAMEAFGNRIRQKGTIIRNPVMQLTSYKRTEPDFRFITAGRLTAQKNQEMLIRAFARFQKHHSGYELWIYGDGPLRQSLLKLIEELALVGKVHLPGNVPDIYDRMVDARCFVLSSDYEGQSNALLEAMSLGLPVIATNCSGIDELIEPSDGILVPVGDESALADAMARIAEDDLSASQLGLSGQNKVGALNMDNIEACWRSVISEVSGVIT